MRQIVKFECEICGELFNRQDWCEEHERKHAKIDKANELLENGETLKTINDITNIWDLELPKYLEDVNKDNCFTISWWQCCEKPAYKIVDISFDGKVKLFGCGSWNGYYGDYVNLNNENLNNPRPSNELFIDKRFCK